MFNLLEYLPVDFVGVFVLSLLDISDIIELERACGSKASSKVFLNIIPYYPSVLLPEPMHKYVSILQWFATRRCKIKYLTITIPKNNPVLLVKNLPVDKVDLHLQSNVTMEDCKPLFESNLGCVINTIGIYRDQNKDVIQQLAMHTRNVEKISISNSNNEKNWLNKDILQCWQLKEFHLNVKITHKSIVKLILQSCPELTSMKIETYNMFDSTVFIDINQYCPKLKYVIITVMDMTYHHLIELSENCAALTEINMLSVPYIPTADIARRCSRTLSCIRYLSTGLRLREDICILIPHMTGLTRIDLNPGCHSCIPLLAQCCHKLTKITVYDNDNPVEHLLSLYRSNPLLEELNYISGGITDTILIELIHTCPYLHTLRLPHATDITDTGILALSKHCPQLLLLIVRNCHKITEVAVLQLLQCCHKLTRLEVSSSSLSEETWTQLDRNTLKRVSRC